MREVNKEQLDENSALAPQATTMVAYPGLAYAKEAHVGTIDVKLLRSVVLGRALVCVPNI